MEKIILITGASSGIGRDAALKLAGQGHRVYAAARRTDKLDELREEFAERTEKASGKCKPGSILPLALDITDEASIEAAVETIIQKEGHIDVLVNNAGFGYFGPIETVPIEEARKQLDVNIFGLASLTKKVLPFMRQNGGGRIINISSIAGRITVPFGGWYNISKYAVEAFSDALRMEVKPYGIKVSIIEPGGIKTAWGGIAADHLEESAAGSVYEERAGRFARTIRKGYGGNLLSPASRIANAISRATNARRPKLRYRTGTGAHSGVFFHAILPARWWDAIICRFLA